MAELVPAISIHETRHMPEFYVYFLASRPGGALYAGVTNNLVRRVFEHMTKLQGIEPMVGIAGTSPAMTR
jgi:hypothetical protein